MEAKQAAPVQTLENAFYNIKVDTQTAEIIYLFDKTQNCELCQKGIGALVHAVGSQNSTLLGNHHKYRIIPPEEIRGFTVSQARMETCSLGQTLLISGQASYGPVDVRFFQPRHQKRLDLSYRVNLQVHTYPEALYVDFDFDLPEDTRILSDSQTTWVDWTNDTMPGACKEWLPLQSAILLKAKHQAVQIASPDAFLFTVGQPVQGLWRSNYLSQESGVITFRYALTNDSEISFEEAHRFGWAQRQGLFAQRMSYQEFREDVAPPFDAASGAQFLEASSSHISLHTMYGSRKETGAFVVRLTENAGRAGNIRLRHNSLVSCQFIDHLERPDGPVQPCEKGELIIKMQPWQVRSVLLRFEPATGR